MECSVCCEKISKEIRCSCGFVCCRSCARTYLAEQVQEPHCMSCKKYWEMDYLEEAIGKSYTSTVFKKIRADVYLEYEKNQLAHTQSLVGKFKRDEECIKGINDLTIKNKGLMNGTYGCIHCMGGRYTSHWCSECKVEDRFNYKVSKSNGNVRFCCLACKKGLLNEEDGKCRKCAQIHCNKCFGIHPDTDSECPEFSCICVDYACDTCKVKENKEKIQYYRLQMQGMTEPKEKREFIMNCQSTGCKGYLSTKYKCGLCEKYTCSTCLIVKEEGVEHVCKEDDISTVRMIRDETKPCPKCSTRISKIDGCDQMWCVECKTAFSWKSGNIVNGTIHNPHYYEFLRQTQGHVPRADNPCGELPGIATLRQLLYKTMDECTRRNIYSFHRFLEEIQWQCRGANPYEPALVQNRIHYLLNRIDEKKFTQKAFMYYQRSLRFQRIQELLQMLRQVLLDQMSRLLDLVKNLPGVPLDKVHEIFLEVYKVCVYFQDQKKRSPYTSIREEHIRICLEYKKTQYLLEEFDMSLWMGSKDLLAFMVR